MKGGLEMSGTEHSEHPLLDAMCIEDLEEILRMDSYGAKDDPYNTDTILYIMEVVAKRRHQSCNSKAQAPIHEALRECKKLYLPDADGTSLYQLDDAECGIAKTQRKVSGETTQKSLRSVFRRVGLAAAIAVLIFGLMITAQAAGLDIFGAIARWTNDTFHFRVNGEAEATYWAEPFKDSLQEVGLDETFVPTYIPEGYVPGELLISEFDGFLQLYLPLNAANSQYIDIVVTMYSDPAQMETILFEKDETPVQELTDENRHIYIFENLDVVHVVCQAGNLICSLSGNENISQNMLLSILNSIEVTER